MSRFSYYFEISKHVCSLRTTPKIWNYLKYRCLSKKAMMSTKRYTPQIGSLLLTLRCNLNCKYCCSPANSLKGIEDLQKYEADLEKVKRIFANPLFANCLLVDLLGGEPLLVKDADRIVSYLSESGHLINTSTNGLLLSDRIVELKQAGISRINVSVYDENLSILERDLVKINQIFPVHTSLVLLRSKVEKQPDKLLEIVRFIRNTGSLSMRFFMYRPMEVKPQPEEIITDTDPAYLEFQRRVNEAVPGFCLWPAIVKTHQVKKRCSQLWQRVNCDMLGNMGICCGTNKNLQPPNNNLFDNKPDIVFNHPTLVNMREKLLDPECAPPAICKTCNLLGEPGW